MKTAGIILLSVLLLVSCHKNAKKGVTGKLRNYTGLDGCGWVIELDHKDANGRDVLEPLNIKDFKMNLKDGEDVVFSYEEQGSMSICMVGPTVHLHSLRKKH